jgi:hypothetical protein
MARALYEECKSYNMKLSNTELNALAVHIRREVLKEKESKFVAQHDPVEIQNRIYGIETLEKAQEAAAEKLREAKKEFDRTYQQPTYCSVSHDVGTILNRAVHMAPSEEEIKNSIVLEGIGKELGMEELIKAMIAKFA